MACHDRSQLSASGTGRRRQGYPWSHRSRRFGCSTNMRGGVYSAFREVRAWLLGRAA